MPPLTGFSDNPLKTNDDLKIATEALLKPLLPHFSAGSARLQLPVHSGAHFDNVAAQLEGYARPLWAVAASLVNPDVTISDRANLVQPWLVGLANGVNPAHAEYWGGIGNWDQRMVEAEIISFALLVAPHAFYDPLSKDAKPNLITWLSGLNGKIMPENNWRWFRGMSNLALIKICGMPRESVWSQIEHDFETLDAFYLEDAGWSADGVWRPGGLDPSEEPVGKDANRSRQADYYSGSFAIQFSQLIYVKLAGDLDPGRTMRYVKSARAFARQFWTYFDKEGAAIPSGRSLMYRFAMGAFYAAFAFAGLCDESDEFLSAGAIKGMLLRHLRSWVCCSDHIFGPDGTLNIGFKYLNMYMCEEYNSLQSPYWALKSLVVTGLGQKDDFWQAEEQVHPLARQAEPRHGVNTIRAPRQITCNAIGGEHHFMLSLGQYCVWLMKAAEAKYCKFAYSSAFGFSVLTSPTLNQIAPDSVLALSRDRGESWVVRNKYTSDTRFVNIPVEGGSPMTAMVNRW